MFLQIHLYMKIIYFITTLFLSLLQFNTHAQINIPDANFRNYLINNSSINTNGDNNINLLEAVAFTGIININNLGVSDMTGIEAFQNLSYLQCEGNQISSLDLSQNTNLLELNCRGNQLTTLDISQNTSLTIFSCRDNQLTSLIVPPSLIDLHCAENALTNIDVSQCSNLVNLWVYLNPITTLDVTQNPNLFLLNFRNTLISTIDLSQNTALDGISCRETLLTSIDVSACSLLTRFLCNSQPDITQINLANGNNVNVTLLNLATNPNLTCIQVDDVQYSTNAWSSAVDPNTSFNLTCFNTTGIEDLEGKNSAISIYPNPVSEELTIETQAVILHNNILNLDGRVLSTTTERNISVSELPAGIYILQIQTDKKLIHKEFIKN